MSAASTWEISRAFFDNYFQTPCTAAVEQVMAGTGCGAVLLGFHVESLLQLLQPHAGG